jgi:hypothetical protein
MGSGHFWSSYGTDRPLLVELGRVRGRGERDEADLAYWKRRVVQSCVYGVDSTASRGSRQAQPLARHRREGPPLSFLDHHLRTGNSLVGPASPSFSAGAAARDARRSETTMPSSRCSGTRPSEQHEHRCRQYGDHRREPRRHGGEVREQDGSTACCADLARRYARLADLVTATQFGVELIRPCGSRSLTTSRVGPPTPPQFQSWLESPRRSPPRCASFTGS